MTQELESYLKEKKVRFLRSYIDNGHLMVLFADIPQQLAASEAVNEHFKDTYITAMANAPRTPGFLRALGLRPMSLGLDLRGGLYLLYQVDVNSSVNQLRRRVMPRTRAATLSAGQHSIRRMRTTLSAATSGRPDTVRVILNPGAGHPCRSQRLEQAAPGPVGFRMWTYPSGYRYPGADDAPTDPAAPGGLRHRPDHDHSAQPGQWTGRFEPIVHTGHRSCQRSAARCGRIRRK